MHSGLFRINDNLIDALGKKHLRMLIQCSEEANEERAKWRKYWDQPIAESVGSNGQECMDWIGLGHREGTICTMDRGRQGEYRQGCVLSELFPLYREMETPIK